MMGVDVPGGIYSHIAGIDIVRAARRGRRATTCSRTTCACPRGVSLHAREPQDDDAAVSRTVRARTAWRRSSTTRTCCSKPCAQSRPVGVTTRPWCVLTPGMYNTRLLRACLPRPADGRRTGRGAGPLREGRRRLHAHHARARSAST
jgi:uncharacterized circularly permuted ATP-grasp superfamily protein